MKRQCLGQDELDHIGKNVTALVERALQEVEQASDQTLSDQEQMLWIDGSRIVFRRRPDMSIPRAVENVIFDKASAPGLQQAKLVSKQPMCSHMGDADSCKDGDAGAVKNNVFNRSRYISIARINGVSCMQPALLATVRSDKILRTFFELLGTSDLEHLISQVHPKLPGDGIGFPKHRDIQFRKSFDPDWQDVLGNGSYAVCFIPIDPMTQENGGLWVDKNNYPEMQGLEEERVWVDAEPGDILFMHPYLYHGSGPNLSQGSRRALLTGFCAFGANHKQYPGADVNVHLTLLEDGTIAAQPAPWSATSSIKSDPNH